jgi:hypothetical protein
MRAKAQIQIESDIGKARLHGPAVPYYGMTKQQTVCHVRYNCIHTYTGAHTNLLGESAPE